MAQSITTQAQAATTQEQAMMAKANRDGVPRAHQQVATMVSRLRDFTRKNTPTFMGQWLKNTPTSSSMKSTRSSILWGYLLVRRTS